MGLTFLASFGKLLESLENQNAWESFFDNSSIDCFATIPTNSIENNSSVSIERQLFLKLLIVKVFRPDQLLSSMEKYIEVIFGKEFPWRGEMNLLDVVSAISNSNAPIMVCSEPGYDASAKVDALAVNIKKRFDSVAMGSSEGFEISDRLIAMSDFLCLFIGNFIG
jgi:dynein heavy chain 1